MAFRAGLVYRLGRRRCAGPAAPTSTDAGPRPEVRSEGCAPPGRGVALRPRPSSTGCRSQPGVVSLPIARVLVGGGP